MLSDEVSFWEKQEPNSKIWWLYDGNDEMVFSFDRVHKLYLFRDYPYKLTKEQKEIFDKENPFWADFFKDRVKENQTCTQIDSNRDAPSSADMRRRSSVL